MLLEICQAANGLIASQAKLLQLNLREGGALTFASQDGDGFAIQSQREGTDVAGRLGFGKRFMITRDDVGFFSGRPDDFFILVEGFLWSPLVFLMLAAVFRAMDRCAV